ncbi:MAG: hypothetical protein JO244_06015, partial [Solirubrobacterales bacterium]|nr:hypothetical protein [Solirubrobacterales bacterium]
VPPLPNQPTAPGWTGSCTFSTPGTYTFHCDLHPFMTGTIVVEAPGETTTTPAPPPGTSPGSSTPSTGSPSPGGPASSPGGPAGAFSVKLNRSQRGHAIAGVVVVPSTYNGGTLEIDVFTSGHRRIGRLLRRSAAQGTFGFSIRIQRGHGKIPLTIQVTLRAHGHPAKSSRTRVLLDT